MGEIVHLRQLQLLPEGPPKEPVLASFGAHQGYSPRHQWLIKAVRSCQADPAALSDPEGHVVTFGMTASMIKAMVYWGVAFKLVQAEASGYYPTEFGELLLGSDEALDPYLEDPATWWLLHWKLLRSPCHAPSWHALLGWTLPSFEEGEALQHLLNVKNQIAPKRSNSALRQDLRCFLKMYLDPEDHHPETMVDHPFADLRLLYELPRSPLDSQRLYHFNIRTKRIPPAILAYCCLDYVATAQPESIRTILFSELTWGDGSPGRAFKLMLHDFAEQVSLLKHPEIQITQSADFKLMLSFERPAQQLAVEVLRDYYADDSQPLASRNSASYGN